MIDPKIVLLLIAIGGGVWVGEKVVAGVKKVEHATVHGAKVAGRAIGHVVKKVAGK